MMIINIIIKAWSWKKISCFMMGDALLVILDPVTLPTAVHYTEWAMPAKNYK